MRTTKIVVEEAGASPEVEGTFSFSQCSRKSEICVEEVASFSLNAPFAETTISAHKDISIHEVVEETDSDNAFGRKMSRGISIVSVSEDEKVSTEKEHVEENDDEMEKLMQRIQKQRTALGEILEQETAKAQEHFNSEKTKENSENVTSVVEEEETEKIEEEEVSEEEDEEDLVKETEKLVEETVKETEKLVEEPVVEAIEEEPVVKEEAKPKHEQPEGSPTNILKFMKFLKPE